MGGRENAKMPMHAEQRRSPFNFVALIADVDASGGGTMCFYAREEQAHSMLTQVCGVEAKEPKARGRTRKDKREAPKEHGVSGPKNGRLFSSVSAVRFFRKR